MHLILLNFLDSDFIAKFEPKKFLHLRKSLNVESNKVIKHFYLLTLSLRLLIIQVLTTLRNSFFSVFFCRITFVEENQINFDSKACLLPNFKRPWASCYVMGEPSKCGEKRKTWSSTEYYTGLTYWASCIIQILHAQ